MERGDGKNNMPPAHITDTPSRARFAHCSSSSPLDPAVATSNHTLAFLLSCWFFYLVVFHSLANLPLHNKLLFGVHQRFWMQPNIFAFIFSGVGLGKGYVYVCTSFLPKTKSINFLAFAAILVGSFAFLFHRSYLRVDQSENYYFDYYAKVRGSERE